MEKKWITLNSHGKYCLKAFILAISGMDILTTQMDYLWDKGIVDSNSKFPSDEYRMRYSIAGKCLTDVGIETAKHYFKNV